jgi:hypothetical protein
VVIWIHQIWNNSTTTTQRKVESIFATSSTNATYYGASRKSTTWLASENIESIDGVLGVVRMAPRQKKKASIPKNVKAQERDTLYVDPDRVRFQHARIRPHFSGCGRSLAETLDSIRQGTMSVDDLPLIQVLVGPVDEVHGSPWYFSLNNRRLWVLKQLRAEGRLDNNQIRVRVRACKSAAEAARYSLENCTVEAKLMRPGKLAAGAASTTKTSPSLYETKKIDVAKDAAVKPALCGPFKHERGVDGEENSGDCDKDSTDDEDDDGMVIGPSNRFSVA